MNKLTLTLTALLLAGGAFGADPPDKKEVPLPFPVVNAEENMRSAVAKAQTEYLKKVEAEVKKLQATLEAEKAKATRSGLLEVALAIKAKQEALTVDAVVTNAAGGGGDLLGDVDPPAKLIIGTWTFQREAGNQPITFKEDGKCIWMGQLPGDYKIDKKSIVISWSNNVKFVISLPLSTTGTKTMELGNANPDYSGVIIKQ